VYSGLLPPAILSRPGIGQLVSESNPSADPQRRVSPGHNAVLPASIDGPVLNVCTMGGFVSPNMNSNPPCSCRLCIQSRSSMKRRMSEICG
jgi:hypothetical protein